MRGSKQRSILGWAAYVFSAAEIKEGKLSTAVLERILELTLACLDQLFLQPELQ